MIVVLVASPARAELDAAGQRCVTTFTKAVRKVVDVQGDIVDRCIAGFAAGKLYQQTPEQCIGVDPRAVLGRTLAKEAAVIGSRCGGGFPEFGASAAAPALARARLAALDLVHEAIAVDLDGALLAGPGGGACQAKVYAALRRCDDARWSEYGRCQSRHLASGAIHDGASMADLCLGTGRDPQPDPKGRLASKCQDKLARAIARGCSQTDLRQAFPACDAGTAAALAACLSRISACQLCRVLGDVGGVVRSCDLFDDGDARNGSCRSTCGDGLIQWDESCDDGNAASGDGCSSACATEPRWFCGEPGRSCRPFAVTITSPAHGSFSAVPSVLVGGTYTAVPVGQASITVNGETPSVWDPVARTFSHVVPLDAQAIVNPVAVTLTDTATGRQAHERVVVLAGDSADRSAMLGHAVTARLGLHGPVEWLLSHELAARLPIVFREKLPIGTRIVNVCDSSTPFGCLARVEVFIRDPEAQFGDMLVFLDTGRVLDSGVELSVVDVRITISSVDFWVRVDGSGFRPDCDSVRVDPIGVDIRARFAAGPDSLDPSKVDVRQLGLVDVSFADMGAHGSCTAFGSTVRDHIRDSQGLVEDAIADALGSDPDGELPGDSLLAQLVEDELNGVSVAGEAGDEVGVDVDGVISDIHATDPAAEGWSGLVVTSDVRFSVAPGGCGAPAGTSELARTFVPATEPAQFGALTPLGAEYDVGAAISAAAINQFLAVQTECGQLHRSIDAEVPFGAVTIPIRIDLAPTLPPIVTGRPGPRGELTGLTIAQLGFQIWLEQADLLVAEGIMDASLGLDLGVSADGAALAATIGAQPSDFSVLLFRNQSPLPDGALAAEIATGAAERVPSLAAAFGELALPKPSGFSIEASESASEGGQIYLHGRLAGVAPPAGLGD